jgi:hypothetical protein
MHKSIIDQLHEMNACLEAVAWAKTQSGPVSAWRSCQRGDWMLWLAGKLYRSTEDRKRLVLAACECARLSLPYVPQGEMRPLRAIETAEKWARGEGATINDVRKAAAAAYAAYYAADAAYAAAAYAAYYAAYAAYYAADAAYYAADAATYTATSAASDAAYAASYTEALAQCADIVRKHYCAAPLRVEKAKSVLAEIGEE